MDYTRHPFRFQVRKALRYARLYGPSRTLAKIRGQYHMKRQYAELPAVDPEKVAAAGPEKHVGIVGCGNFAYSNIAYYLAKHHGRVIRASMDRHPERAASLYERYGLDYYTDDADRVLEDPAIDLVYVASNHASHAEYGIRALENGKSVHIEKPHVVDDDQLLRLCRAMQASPARVRLGFNRPGSPIGRKIAEALAAESGNAMFNWFIGGHRIAKDNWYLSPSEGGRVLGNLCHWTDFVYRLVPPEARYPIRIHPARARRTDVDIAVSFVFGDGTIAAITFSEKGDLFEGVRETLAAHRGDALVAMNDFQRLTIDVMDKKHRYRGWFRDHGHRQAVLRSYAMSPRGGESEPGESIEDVWQTAELFLRTREALERDAPVIVEAFDSSRLRSSEVSRAGT